MAEFTYVIAGNVAQYHDWRREDAERLHSRYVNHSYQLRGARGRLVRVGSWYEDMSPDFLDAVAEALARGDLREQEATTP